MKCMSHSSVFGGLHEGLVSILADFGHASQHILGTWRPLRIKESRGVLVAAPQHLHYYRQTPGGVRECGLLEKKQH